ncbi:MAG: hypothetical protein MJZ52_04510 [Bacteroidales bacterium]|nr:hypothetical protein [Bacteroidales bacterium]
MPSGVFVAGYIIGFRKKHDDCPAKHLTSAAGACYSARALPKKVVLSQPLQVGQKGGISVRWVIHSVAFLEFYTVEKSQYE